MRRMTKPQKTRMGRPPGQKYPHMIHLRITDEMRSDIEEIIASRSATDPDMAVVIRELIAAAVSNWRRERKGKP